jgi:hypothetical protein
LIVFRSLPGVCIRAEGKLHRSNDRSDGDHRFSFGDVTRSVHRQGSAPGSIRGARRRSEMSMKSKYSRPRWRSPLVSTGALDYLTACCSGGDFGKKSGESLFDE